MKERVTLQLIQLLHDMDNFIQSSMEINDPVLDEDGDVVIAPEPPEIIERFKKALDAIQTIGPVIRVIEEYMEGELSSSTFIRRWDNIMTAIDEASEERGMSRVAGDVMGALTDIQKGATE